MKKTAYFKGKVGGWFMNLGEYPLSLLLHRKPKDNITVQNDLKYGEGKRETINMIFDHTVTDKQPAFISFFKRCLSNKVFWKIIIVCWKLFVINRHFLPRLVLLLNFLEQVNQSVHMLILLHIYHDWFSQQSLIATNMVQQYLQLWYLQQNL